MTPSPNDGIIELNDRVALLRFLSIPAIDKVYGKKPGQNIFGKGGDPAFVAPQRLLQFQAELVE